MRTTEQYTLENVLIPYIPLASRILMDSPQKDSEQQLKTGDSYPLIETLYDQWIREGLIFKLVTEKELPPGVKGLYNPVTGEAFGVDQETRTHETNHHVLLRNYPRTQDHEHQTRLLTKNMLNHQGVRANYHE